MRNETSEKAIAPVEASAREQAHPAAVTISVVLDLVQPLRAGGRLAGYAGDIAACLDARSYPGLARRRQLGAARQRRCRRR
jgi:hypothetical protein